MSVINKLQGKIHKKGLRRSPYPSSAVDYNTRPKTEQEFRDDLADAILVKSGLDWQDFDIDSLVSLFEGDDLKKLCQSLDHYLQSKNGTLEAARESRVSAYSKKNELMETVLAVLGIEIEQLDIAGFGRAFSAAVDRPELGFRELCVIEEKSEDKEEGKEESVVPGFVSGSDDIFANVQKPFFAVSGKNMPNSPRPNRSDSVPHGSLDNSRGKHAKPSHFEDSVEGKHIVERRLTRREDSEEGEVRNAGVNVERRNQLKRQERELDDSFAACFDDDLMEDNLELDEFQEEPSFPAEASSASTLTSDNEEELLQGVDYPYDVFDIKPQASLPSTQTTEHTEPFEKKKGRGVADEIAAPEVGFSRVGSEAATPEVAASVGVSEAATPEVDASRAGFGVDEVRSRDAVSEPSEVAVLSKDLVEGLPESKGVGGFAGGSIEGSVDRTNEADNFDDMANSLDSKSFTDQEDVVDSIEVDSADATEDTGSTEGVEVVSVEDSEDESEVVDPLQEDCLKENDITKTCGSFDGDEETIASIEVFDSEEEANPSDEDEKDNEAIADFTVDESDEPESSNDSGQIYEVSFTISKIPKRKM